MRFPIGLLASSAAAVVFVACSSPNPLGGLPQFGAGSGDAGSSAPASNGNAPGDDNNGDDSPGGSAGATSAPSPVIPKGQDPESDGGTDDGGASEGGMATPGDASAPTSDGGASSSLLARCVSDLNSYRSQAGVKALTESSALEAYGALAATSDSQSGTVHGYFAGNSGNGVSAAESEIPGWALNQYASASDLVDQGVSAIFNQGPGAAPYDNLVNATFTQAGCGLATTSDGNVWVTFEYK
jgi:hypothetical protein